MMINIDVGLDMNDIFILAWGDDINSVEYISVSSDILKEI